MSRPERVDAVLVAGGKYHDIDFARMELLKLLAEHPHVRVTVAPDYGVADAIGRSRFLVSYTCDVRPSEAEQAQLVQFVREGGRWLAPHGTNAALDFTAKGVAAPRCFPTLARLLGSLFVAHPPIQPYRVEGCAAEHPLVAGVEPFDTDDELYLSEYHDREQLVPLLRHALPRERGRLHRERLVDGRPPARLLPASVRQRSRASTGGTNCSGTCLADGTRP